jgi:hypothetical protein
MADPQKDEHIEELLSKLQGIFGKLSHSEEEESRPKVDSPKLAPKDSEKKQTNAPVTFNAPAPTIPTPLNLYTDPPNPEASPVPAAPTDPAAAPADGGRLSEASGYETTVPLEDPEKIIVPAAVFYPPGRENEAKSAAQKLETMTPKFTKVAFRLRVGVFHPYDPKSEWKDSLVAKVVQAQSQTVFVLVERPLDDAKRKAVVAALEIQRIYLQEIPVVSIEKKAFYTDVLLGLVFFFDSHRPSPGPDVPIP